MKSETRPAARERFPVDVARRIALAGQGFDEPRPSGEVDVRQVRRVLDRVGALQLDSVNVVCRSHYLPLFARLGPYPRALLDEMAWGGGRREAFEYWGHKASLLPLGTYPLLRWRMEAATRWDWDGWSATTGIPAGWRESLDPTLLLAPWAVVEGMTWRAKERPGLVDEVLAVVAARGPLAAGEANPDGQRRRGPQAEGGRMWNWQDAKIALEWLFYRGTVTTATRRNFERLYDLTERVLPADVLAAPSPGQEYAQRELLRIAARALGIATEKQLRQYFFIPAAQARARLAELVDAGELVPVRVEGVSQRTYLWPDAAAPPRVQARALLSPFDSLIWDRDRTQRLFGFHYRISIYTRADERTHGYYVLPFLLGDRLVARVALKADRQRSALVAEGAYPEPGIDERVVAGELAQELRVMARWLELDRVLVDRQGQLSASLSRAVSAQPR
jgi:uncharacterized protein YcaQ